MFDILARMSTLRSALDELASEDVHRFSDAELTDHLREIEPGGADARIGTCEDGRRSRGSPSVRGRRVPFGDVVARPHERVSSRRRLRDRCGSPARSLTCQRRARLSSSEISVAAPMMLAAAREADAEAFDRCEDALVRAARALPVRDLRRAIDHWLQLAEVEAARGADESRFRRRGLFVSTTIGGMVRLDGDLDPETAQTVMTALRSIVDAGAREADDDDRRPAQRRADALGEICRWYLDSSDLPFAAPPAEGIDRGTARDHSSSRPAEHTPALACTD
jgi:Domain of unknown function (DUF222)